MVILICFRFSVVLFDFPGISSSRQYVGSVESLCLDLFGNFRDLCLTVISH